MVPAPGENYPNRGLSGANITPRPGSIPEGGAGGGWPRPGFSIRPLASLKKNAYYVSWVQARAATTGNIFSRDPAAARARGLKLKRRMTVDAEH